jgi:hypothetical protein
MANNEFRETQATVLREWRESATPSLYFIRFTYQDPFTGELVEEEDHAGPYRPTRISYGHTIVVFPPKGGKCLQ